MLFSTTKTTSTTTTTSAVVLLHHHAHLYRRSPPPPPYQPPLPISITTTPTSATAPHVTLRSPTSCCLSSICSGKKKSSLCLWLHFTRKTNFMGKPLVGEITVSTEYIFIWTWTISDSPAAKHAEKDRL